MNIVARRTALAWLLLTCGLGAAHADTAPQPLPFAQAWTDATQITANDDWSGVPGIQGFLGQDITTATAADPQTLTGTSAAANDLDVIANLASTASTAGGVAEFDALPNPSIALQGSGTADAPNIVISLNTLGHSGITVAYTLRDLDGTADNAIQPVALQYRVGDTGAFINVPAGYVADATTGPSLATLATPVSALLPAAADNAALVQVRIITANAAGSDEWVGVDDIAIASGVAPADPVLSISSTAAAEGDSGTTPFFFTASLTAPAGPGGVSFYYATSDGTATAGADYVAASGSATIAEGQTSTTLSVDVVGDTTTEPNETFNVTVSNVQGALPGTLVGIGTINNDDVVLVPIHAIQGSGATSPLVGQTVTTSGIVTGRKTAGFFLQSADADADADPATSEGVYVFTSSAPPASAAVGNRVQVTATVIEYTPAADLGQLPLTELGGAVAVNLLTIGNALPTPVTLTTALPSPSGALDQLERFEGMRVTAPSFTVVAPTGGTTNEPNATGTSNGIFSVVVTGTPRPFREPGIQAPDAPPAGSSIPPIPQWDFNPELLTVTSRTLGGPAIDVAAGATIANLVGPLDYGFRRYTVLPDPAVVPAITAGPAPSAARLPTADEFTVASYNVERFFDTSNDPATDDPVLTPAALTARLNKASLGIRNFLNTPDILAVMEMENLANLQAVASRVNSDAVAAGQPDPGYVAYLQEGNDVGGIDVGFLVKTSTVTGGLARVEVLGTTQLGKTETWVEPAGGSSLLNDRPPLKLDAVVHFANGKLFPLTVIAVHQRSLNGADEDSAAGQRIRAKRQKQAEYLATQVQLLQEAAPLHPLVVLGDYNAFAFNDGFVDAMGTVIGAPSPDNQTVVPGDGNDLVEPNLRNLADLEPVDQRYSFVFDGNAQSLDHIVVNQGMQSAANAIALDHARINANFPEVNRNDANSASRLADHDPAVAYFAVTRADLGVTAIAPASYVPANAVLAFNVVAANAGPDAAAFPGVGFAIDAALPDLAIVAPAGWSCDAPVVVAATTTASCLADTLASGASATFDLTAAAPVSAIGSNLTLQAAATAQTPDPVTADNTDSAVITVGPPASTDVGIALLSPSLLSPGMTSTIVAITSGHERAVTPGIVVQLALDVPSANVALAAPGGWACVRGPEAAFRARCVAQPSGAIGARFAMTINLPPVRRPTVTVQAIVDAPDDTNAANDAATRRIRVAGIIQR